MEIVITTNKLEKILQKGIGVDCYIILNLLKNNEKEVAEKSWSDFTDLIVGGWITIGKTLTPKALSLINELEGKSVEVKVEDMRMLYDRIVVKFTQLTGKKQKMVDGKYAFVPNYSDFSSKLLKVIKKYKLNDKAKLEKVLINYICRAHKANFQMIPLLGYYIEKNSSSQLASDYENFEEKDVVEVKKEVKEVKTLF